MPTPDPKPGEPLSKRETQVYGLLIGTDHSNKQIGDKLFISERSIKYHARRIYIKRRVSTRLQLIFQERTELAA